MNRSAGERLGKSRFIAFYFVNWTKFFVSRSYKANFDNSSSGQAGLRHVISILSNTVITEGDGSQSTPWIID